MLVKHWRKKNMNNEIIKYAKTLKASSTLTMLSNASAYLNHYLDDINWVGFYLFNGTKLILGPFQGEVACEEIELGKGVCGNSALEKKSFVVPNVHEFPGHIACDSRSNSEIVVPIIINDKLYGVLDIDSPNYNRFGEEEKNILEQFVEIIKEFVNVDKIY